VGNGRLTNRKKKKKRDNKYPSPFLSHPLSTGERNRGKKKKKKKKKKEETAREAEWCA